MIKNCFKILILILSFIIICPFNVKADTITNMNGIEITREEYDNFIQVHSHEYIMTMDLEDYEKLLTLDYDNITSTTKYIATTYNPSLNITTEVELTEQEYNNFVQPNLGLENIYSPNLNNGSAYLETTAKQLSMVLVGGVNWDYATLTASWKYIPSTRVYDVIGFMGDGLSFRNGSQTGNQMYIDASGVYHNINYAWNGTNIKKFNNGFGISMNLVNPTIQSLVLDIACDVQATITHPSLSGAYEHAINSSVTLAQSQNYTLGGSGLGGVFIYPYNISIYYDGMSGLDLFF